MRNTDFKIRVISDRFNAQAVKRFLFGNIVLIIVLLSITGCKKQSVSTDKQFGDAKLTVECAKKCHVSYGTADKLTEADIDSTIGTYTIKYERNYNLVIKVMPLNEDQRIVLNVFSRENKQIFTNSATRKVNELWTSTVLIP
ncbi:MAG: hypothetical protein JWR05_2273 [Mucilaginibacter sp.]|nr:hypothetical protein [Mucilaginibacter sp.]